MTPPAVCIRDLTFRYPDGTMALQNLSLEVPPGARVALLGSNGAGKSTLLLCLNGLNDPAGTIEVEGVPVTRPNLAALRARIGLVFQNPDDQLFCPTLFDDVAFGPRNQGLPEDQVLTRVHDALHAVGLDGLEEKSAFHLSFGQRKRAALATVLSMKPGILALDEPSANLHPRARRELAAVLRAAGGTHLIATHDFDLARDVCDRAVLMWKGRVEAEGTVAEILGDRKRLEDVELE